MPLPLQEKAEEWILCNLSHRISIRWEDWKKASSFATRLKAAKQTYTAEITHDSTPGRYFYKASESENFKWHPSIHMPKEAARIWLKVTDVRVERLQDITIEGIRKEGLEPRFNVKDKFSDGIARGRFLELWNNTIKKSALDKYGWDANPWVWVIEFERCEKPENE